MKPLHKILVPTDFSPASRAALKAACELARGAGAEVTLLHVYAPPVLAYPEFGGLATVDAGLLRYLDGALGEVRREAELRLGRGVAAKLLPGGAAAEISREAEEGGYDLVVVGSHGRTGLSRLILGSVAERTIQSAPCSVLVIREATEPLGAAAEP
jgi:universal stress protein A